MAEAQIQYCTSADGTRIAYAVIEGRERPLLFVNFMFLPIRAARLGTRGASAGVAAGRRNVRFDRRGVGYSQGPVSDFSLDAQVADVLAVATQARLSGVDVMGFGDGCLVAAAFAARHPEFVRRLALSGPTQTGGVPAWHSMAMMARSNWALGRGTIADLVHAGDAEPEGRRAYIRFLGEVLSPETAASYMEAAWDPGPELHSVTAPTLVIYPKRRLGGPIEASQTLAAGIPGARFLAPDVDDLDPAYVTAVREFFGDVEVRHETQGSRRDAEGSVASGTAVILFTDVADSTALTERMGDAAYRTLSRSVDERVRAAMRERSGTVVEGKVLGDGVMGVFATASQAIAAARACVEIGQELPMHVGLHAGDVTHEAGNVYGGAVNIASRICGLSAPGEILVSDVVRGMARSSAGVAFEDRGEQEMKGVGEPVRVYAVRGSA